MVHVNTVWEEDICAVRRRATRRAPAVSKAVSATRAMHGNSRVVLRNFHARNGTAISSKLPTQAFLFLSLKVSFARDRVPAAVAETRRRRFQTTRWSLVLAAGGDHSSAAHLALATLCEIYWYPLYAYVRRQGHDADESKDLTQAFFAQLLERHDIQGLRKERGRLRSYLLGALRHFLLNQDIRNHALKRGGQQASISLEFDAAEHRYSQELAEITTPERIYERRWALTVLDQVFQDLRGEWASAGRGGDFDILKECLAGDVPPGGYQSVATTLGCTVNAATVAVHRLRRAFRRQLRDVIADTVVSEDAIDDEIRHLFVVLRT